YPALEEIGRGGEPDGACTQYGYRQLGDGSRFQHVDSLRWVGGRQQVAAWSSLSRVINSDSAFSTDLRSCSWSETSSPSACASRVRSSSWTVRSPSAVSVTSRLRASLGLASLVTRP